MKHTATNQTCRYTTSSQPCKIHRTVFQGTHSDGPGLTHEAQLVLPRPHGWDRAVYPGQVAQVEVGVDLDVADLGLHSLLQLLRGVHRRHLRRRVAVGWW